MRRRVTGANSQDGWIGIILLATILVFGISSYAISHDIHTVISHLFYIPVILACWRFPIPGVLFSVFLAIGYIGIEHYIPGRDLLDSDAVLRGLLFVCIGGVVAYLSSYLQFREESYRRLLSTIDSGVVVMDKQGFILYLNTYAQHVLDRKGKQVLHTKLSDYSDNPDEVDQLLIECSKTSPEQHSRELFLRRNDGFPVPVFLTCYCDKMGDFIGTLTDLSEEKWMSHELDSSRAITRILLDAIPEGVFLADTRGVLLQVNQACHAITGWEEGIKAELNPELWEPDSVLSLTNGLSYAARDRESEEFTLISNSQSGSYHYEATLIPVPDENGVVTRIAGVLHDITAQEKYFQKIREREEYLRMILDGLPLATVVIDPAHTVLTVNKALSMLFEQEVADLIDSDTHQLLLFPLRERPLLCDIMVENEVDVLLDEHYEGLYAPSPTVPGAFEVIDYYPHIGEAGKWIRSTAARLVDENGGIIGAVETFEDFNSRKEAEETIRMSEERFKVASHIATDLIFEYDQKTDQIEWFGDIEKWLGLKSPGIVRTLTGWTTLLHHDDISRIKGAFIQHVLTGEPINEELRIKHRNGQYQVWIIKAVALFNTNLQQIKTVGVVTDISEIRDIEEAKKKALIAIEKNIEQFAILGDHIRNPLQVISGYNALLDGVYSDKIAAQIQHINSIIDQLDKGWIESDSIREFLRRHYGIAEKKEV